MLPIHNCSRVQSKSPLPVRFTITARESGVPGMDGGFPHDCAVSCTSSPISPCSFAPLSSVLLLFSCVYSYCLYCCSLLLYIPCRIIFAFTCLMIALLLCAHQANTLNACLLMLLCSYVALLSTHGVLTNF